MSFISERHFSLKNLQGLNTCSNGIQIEKCNGYQNNLE